VVDRITPADLPRPTPCPPWDLAALLGHMIGQNHGFADAVSADEDVAPSAFAPRPVGGRPGEEWAASALRLTGAFAGADASRPVLLAEISTDQRFPTALVIGFHLLDTVVHGWDVATTLGQDYRPEHELVTATLELARLVPDGPHREQPDSSFRPPLPVTEDRSAWERALALLGRRATVTRRATVDRARP
jgi:uncharacterized protein (TIGR03086 family)